MESKKKLKGTIETNNYKLIHSCVNRHTGAQAGVVIWIQRSIKKVITNYMNWSNRKTEVKLEYWKREIIIFWALHPSRRKR